MGAWRMVGAAAATAVLLFATRASGGMVVVPIARLSLEGGYDSNPLYDDGPASRSARLSPDLGLALRAPLWDLRGTYGGELVYMESAATHRLWNHRAELLLDALPTRRTATTVRALLTEAIDPAALAGVGVFRTGRLRALIVSGHGRVEWRAERDVTLGGTYAERTVLFDDGSGGALHAPGVEALWRRGRRLWLGGAYGFGLFQTFEPAPAADVTATSHALRARVRFEATRHVSVVAWAGPALWLPEDDGNSVVPEAFAQLLFATRGMDLRVNVGHALGIGATAHPGLVDALELAGERRFVRRWFARASGGMWRSGTIPSGRDGVTGYAIRGEAGVRLENDFRLSLTAAQYGRVDESSRAFSRTTVGMRLAWEMPSRR